MKMKGLSHIIALKPRIHLLGIYIETEEILNLGNFNLLANDSMSAPNNIGEQGLVIT